VAACDARELRRGVAELRGVRRDVGDDMVDCRFEMECEMTN
jgi:hypothetical protein